MEDVEQILDEIKAIADSCTKEIGFVLRPSLKESLLKGTIITVEKNNMVVGFVNFRHRMRDKQTTIYELVVSKEYRNQGLGKKLIEKLIEECIKLNRDFILLKCPEDNESNRFYKKYGFTFIKKQKGKKRDLNIWALEIPKINKYKKWV